jgi:hypothetical protein
MFGPSLKSIVDTALDVDAWLDNECVKGYKDFDGAWIDLPPTEEEQFAMQRRDQLIELMHLKKPISPAWAIGSINFLGGVAAPS